MFHEKPDVWFEGIFEPSMPKFMEPKEEEPEPPEPEELVFGADNQFQYTKLNDSVTKVEALALIHKFRYRCWYGIYEQQPTKTYNVAVQFCSSTEKVQGLWYQVQPVRYTFIEENSLEEIIHKIIIDFNDNNWTEEFENQVGTLLITDPGKHINEITKFIMKYRYDYKIGKLSLEVLSSSSIGEDPVLFEFRTYQRNSYPNLITQYANLKYFLKFLNQEVYLQNYLILIEPTIMKTFEEGVWNRKLAQFHASFSNASRQYIGLNNDFWYAPNRLFFYNHTSTFSIRFSFDGINYFLPRYFMFIIELTYIFNY